MKRFVIAALVENKYGVLTRVAGLFMRKGFNIDSLTVGETEDSSFSRITITLRGDDNDKDQLISQLRKLHNVTYVKHVDKKNSVERELILIKVKNTVQNRSEIMAITEIYRAKIVDYNPKTICVVMTGKPSKINAFIEILRPLGIVELCRTGVVAIERNKAIYNV